MKTSILQKLTQWNEATLRQLSTKMLSLTCFITFILAVYFNVIATQEFFRARYPVSLIEGQLAFSGTMMKAHHQTLIAQGTMDIYRNVQYLDFGLMLFTGLFLALSVLLVTTGHQTHTIWRRFGVIGAIIIFVPSIMDAIENCFLLIMLSNPLSFPNWLAIVYSSAALAKLVIFLIGGIWLIVSGLVLAYRKIANILTKQKPLQSS